MTPFVRDSSDANPPMPRPTSDSAPSGASAEPGTAAEAFSERLRRVARGDATVLLVGESGTGKSRAARAIHDASARAGGPFVATHLAGLAPTLLEAELFGHVAGAFTGAHRAREGRFQRAEGGTIVLEAIETLDLSLQVKLLRVLQERVVEPLGAEALVPVDVRVIATASRDLPQAIEEGTFREDLYYRLAVVPLAVPPLRARVADADFPALVGAIAEAVAARVGRPARPLGPGVLEGLAAHPWPGNLRELENALERVLVLGDSGQEIRMEEFAFLREAIRGRASEIAALALASGVGLEAIDAALIEEALRQERGNLSAAARAVGLSRRAFDYRRKKLQAQQEPDEDPGTAPD